MRNQSTATEAGKTIERINRLRITFTEFALGDQEKIINLISDEIEALEDEAVKFWLIKFISILDNVKTGGAR